MAMRLRLTYLAPFYDPATQFGGPIVILRELCQSMAERGHVVRVVANDVGIDENFPRDQWLERDGYYIWYGRGGLLSKYAPYYTPHLRRPLNEALADSDLLHMPLGLTLVNALGRRLARQHGVPYVYSPQGVLCPHRLLDRRWSKWLFLHLFERRVVRDAAALQALTRKEYEDLRGQGGRPEQIHTIPNGIDMGDPGDWPSGEAFRHDWDIPADVPLVLFLSRVAPVKGLDLLVEAFAQAKREHPTLMLAVVGPDHGAVEPARRQAATLGITEALRFTGKLDGQARLSAFRAADIFALTSYSEGLPMAVLEACAMGVPALLTEGCQVPEVGEAAPVASNRRTPMPWRQPCVTCCAILSSFKPWASAPAASSPNASPVNTSPTASKHCTAKWSANGPTCTPPHIKPNFCSSSAAPRRCAT